MAKQTWFRDLAVILYNRYMINVQNFIQILYLVLSDGRLICRDIWYLAVGLFHNLLQSGLYFYLRY